MIRTFLALELDDETRNALAAHLEVLRRYAPRISWVKPDNMHVTIKFIGNVPEADLPELFDVADDAASRCAPFLLDIEGLGCFPDLRRPRIVWAGGGAGADACIELVKETEVACEILGYEPEHRPFTPHVTIGRVRHPSRAEGLAEALDKTISFGTVEVRTLTVFMSTLKREGAEYTPMHRAPLARE